MSGGPITDAERVEADLFYATYGRALARWADIEGYLTVLFERVSGLDREKALQIFHSANSWRGKYQMLSAALASFKSRPGHAKSLKTVLGVCNQYALSRNDLAHGAIRMVQTLEGYRYLTISPMQTPDGPHIPPETLAPYEVQAIEWHFLLLGALIVTCFGDYTDQLASPERVEMLAGLLPIPAHSTRLDPSIGESFLICFPDHQSHLW